MSRQLTRSILLLVGALAPLHAQDAQATTVTLPAGDTFVAPAPVGTSSDYLGAGLAADLSDVDSSGVTLTRAFPNEFTTIPENAYRFEAVAVESSFDQRVQAAYGVLGGKVEVSSDQRVLILHGFQIARVERLKVAPGATAQGQAAVTPIEIWYGWSASVAVCGAAKDFTSEVRANLVLGGADARTVASQKRLATSVSLRGLSERGGSPAALVMSSPERLLAQFERAAEPSAIFVRYRRLKPISATRIAWVAGDAGGSACYRFKVTSLQIEPKKPKEPNAREALTWDPLFGNPDPVVVVSLFTDENGDGRISKEEQSRARQFRSQEVKDSLAPDVRFENPVFSLSGRTVMTVHVLDMDVGDPELIGWSGQTVYWVNDLVRDRLGQDVEIPCGPSARLVISFERE